MLKPVLRGLLVLLVCAIGGIAVDPGFDTLWRQLSYSLREGESIVPQVVALSISLVVLAGPLFIHSKKLVIGYLGFVFLALMVGLTFVEINGQFTDWEAKLIVSEFGFAAGAISTFLDPIFAVLPIALVSVVVLYFARYPFLKRGWSLLGFVPWLLPVLYVAVASGGDNIRHVQLALKVPTQLLFEIANPYPIVEKRDEPTISVVEKADHHIVYIIDESIRGDLLTINNPELATTPKLAALLETLPHANYGVISSTTNCSATSNLLLRTGGQPSELPDSSGKLFSKSSLFSYAKHAGLTTHYYDAQVSTASRPQNFFSKAEVEAIDEYLPMKALSELPGYELDMAMSARFIERIVQDSTPSFTYVNKFGTHFPYETTYPNAADGLSKKAHYQAALHWAVDAYLVDLIEQAKATQQKVLIVYTSDHGQGLGEQGSLSTHCLPENPTMYQGSVPLLMIGVNTALPMSLQAQPGQPYSQFQVASSLLQLMGYTQADANNELGQDLSQPWQGERFFYSGDLTGRGALRKNPFPTNIQ